MGHADTDLSGFIANKSEVIIDGSNDEDVLNTIEIFDVPRTRTRIINRSSDHEGLSEDDRVEFDELDDFYHI
jgi:hypothetical protein